VAEETPEQINRDDAIVAWTGDRNAIVSYVNQALEPESIYPGWINLVSQRSIRAIAISPKSGHIWLATWGGVLLWRQREENTYFRYSSEHGLLGNGISSLCVDEDERPWVCHQEGGLGYFENNRWHVYSERKSEIFRLICRQHSGGVWAATSNCIYSIPGPKQPSVPVLVNHGELQYPQAFLEDENGLLIGSHQGLFRLLITGEVEQIEPERIKSCSSLARDDRNQIWIGAGKQVYAMRDGQLNPDPFYEGDAGYVRHVAAGRDLVWLLTTEGISVIDGEWKAVSYHSEEAPTPKTIAVSSADRFLWVGTDSLLSSLIYNNSDSGSWQHSELPPHPEDELNNLARCIAASQKSKTIWLGNASGLVTFESNDSWLIDRTLGDIRALCVSTTGNVETLWFLRWPIGFWAQGFENDQPPGIPIALARGIDGHAYGLTTRGLWRLGKKATAIADGLNPRVRCLSQTADGRWWAGASEGVYVHKQGTWTAANEVPGPGLSEIYALLTHDDKLWVAAANGLWRRSGNVWEAHNDLDQQPVRALASASDGIRIWLADDGKVVRYSPETRMCDKNYSSEHAGVASKRVTALKEINGQLWIATEAGVAKLELSEEAN
jgi:ligand-binding sensor domain-containing protein